MTALFLTRNGTLRPNRRPKAYGAKHKQLAAETKHSQPEQTMQIALVRDLRAVLAPGVFLTHIPSGFIAGRSGPLRGAFLKAMGLIPGCPDLMILHGGAAWFLELKSAKGKLSTAQAECHIALRRAGCHVETIRNLDEALECLSIWNIPTRIKPSTIRQDAA